MDKRHIPVVGIVILVSLIVILCMVVTDQRIDINTLQDDQFYVAMVDVKGIGPVLAKRSVDYRRARGSIVADELIDVDGIGPKRLHEIKKKFK